MDFNQRVLDLIEHKRKLTEQINSELQRLQDLGQNLTNYQELFHLPRLPPVVDEQEA